MEHFPELDRQAKILETMIADMFLGGDYCYEDLLEIAELLLGKNNVAVKDYRNLLQNTE